MQTSLMKQIEILIYRYKNAKLENKSLEKQNKMLRKSYAIKTLKIQEVEKRLNKLLQKL
jgi:hypothetical protein